MRVEEKLKEMGLELPNTPKPTGNYVPAVKTGSLVFTSGQTARINGVRRYVGRVGLDINAEDAYLSARDSCLNCLACLKAVVGDLDKVKRIVKVVGFINVEKGYLELPAIINGASDLLCELFGDNGKPARSAVGMTELPFNVSVELEMIAEVED